MNILKRSILFLTIIMIHHYHFSSHSERINQNYNKKLAIEHLYNKTTDHTDAQTTDRLTQESYITPEMQWEVLSILNQKSLTINKFTGEVQGIAPTNQLITIINQKLESMINAQEKEILKNGLRTMLEATEIAIFVANVEAALKDSKFILYQTVNSQLLTNLQTQKQTIESMLKRVNALQVGQQSSYFSWLWGSSESNQQQSIPDSSTLIEINPYSEMITIPAELIPSIIKNNDYKQMQNPVEAANLLFKQCFIAQQHHLKDFNFFHKIHINLQNPISAYNYIYTNFPDFNTICTIIKQSVEGQYRANFQSIQTLEQKRAHKLLLDVRQAIETALYIANKKSDINLGYLLPQFIKSQLDSILWQLLQYEQEIKMLCKDPQLGATVDDIYQEEQWANITKFAAGAAFVALAATGLYTYAPTFLGIAAQKGSDLMNWWNTKKPEQIAPNQTINQAPTQEKAETTNSEKQKEASWYNYVPAITTIGKVASGASFTGGIASQVGKTLATHAEDQATIELGNYLNYYGNKARIIGSIGKGLTGELNDIGGSIGTASSFIPGKAGAASSAIGATIDATGTIYNAYQSGGSGLSSGLVVAATTNAIDQILNAKEAFQNNDPHHNNVTVNQQISPEKIYNAFIAIIQDTIKEGQNLLDRLHQFISYLFQQNIANPPLVIHILQNLPADLIKNSAVQQPVNQAIAELQQFQNQAH